MNTDDFEKIIHEAVIGKKKVKFQKIISKFNIEDGITEETEEGRDYVPGIGLIQGRREKEKILSCGHSSRLGLGHFAECGHVVCRLCVEKYTLVCAHPGCFRKLCTVKGCSNSARMMSGVYFCKKHQFSEVVVALGSLLFLGRRRTQEIINEVKQDYYSGFLAEKKKELPYGRQNLPGKSSRALGFPEKTGHVERRNPSNIS